jgi:hypothetical protein
MRRGILVFVFAILCALGLLSAAPALAGGWSVVKLDAVPTEVVAGKPISIGFTVLQHGVSPLSGLSPIVEATHVSSGQKEEFAASAQGESGHYVAEVSFPTSGAWNWSINVFEGEHAMPQIEVQAVTPQAKSVMSDVMSGVEINSPPQVTSDQFAQSNPDFGSAPAPVERRLALGLGAGGIAVLTAAGLLAPAQVAQGSCRHEAIHADAEPWAIG